MRKTIRTILGILGVTGLLILIISSVSIALFNHAIAKEKKELFYTSHPSLDKISEKDLDAFPDLMKKYLIKANIIGKSKYCNVVFQQKGKIRTQEDKDWLPFTATQYMSSYNPGFIWQAKTLPIIVRDKYANHKGEMRVSLLGLHNIALSTGAEMDESALGRYLGELVCFPIGFLDPDILWEPIDFQSVKAIITKGKSTVVGEFFFNDHGMIHRFKTKRYRDTTIENFIGEVGDYIHQDGLLIPSSLTAIWDLKEGKVPYFKADITHYTLTSGFSL